MGRGGRGIEMGTVVEKGAWVHVGGRDATE